MSLLVPVSALCAIRIRFGGSSRVCVPPTPTPEGPAWHLVRLRVRMAPAAFSRIGSRPPRGGGGAFAHGTLERLEGFTAAKTVTNCVFTTILSLPQILCVAKRVQNKKRIPGLACKYWNYQTSQRVGARNSEVQKRENIFVSHFINIIKIFFFTKVASSSQFYLVWGAVPVCFD